MGKSKNLNNADAGKMNVIIVGASIENLGAESMTSVIIEKVRTLVPDCVIYLASLDKKGMQVKIRHNVIEYVFPTDTEWHKNSLIGMVLKSKLGKRRNKRYEDVLRNTKFIIDISGYSFTTKFGVISLYLYLNRIFCAKSLQIPYYICSQSFGPVEIENLKEKLIFNRLTKNLFKYPEIITAREKKGYNYLKKYCHKNLVYKPDIVLLYPNELNYSNLRKDITFDRVAIKTGRSVAIVPNEKITIKTKNGVKYIDGLKRIINNLIDDDYEVWVVAHCNLDLFICETLVNEFRSNVGFIDCTKSGSAFFDDVVQCFSFLVAARYHSIVHSYRRFKPVLVFGWEDKYNELLCEMKQQQYMIDCREDINEDEIEVKLEQLKQNISAESARIQTTLETLREKYK